MATETNPPDNAALHRLAAPGTCPLACDRTAAGRFAALCDRQSSGFPPIDTTNSARRAPSAQSPNDHHQRRAEMSTIMKNKSLLLLPIGLAILIVIGILTS